jgi:hypothetical protein
MDKEKLSELVDCYNTLVKLYNKTNDDTFLNSAWKVIEEINSYKK